MVKDESENPPDAFRNEITVTHQHLSEGRRPNWTVLVFICLAYWGLLYYWLWDEFSAGGDNEVRALVILSSSISYVLIVMWVTMTDLPERVSQMPLVGKYAKTYWWHTKTCLWLIMVCFFIYWGLVDKAASGFIYIGILLLGSATSLALSCLLYIGKGGNRLYGLKRLIEVNPSTSNTHVGKDFPPWTNTIFKIFFISLYFPYFIFFYVKESREKKQEYNRRLMREKEKRWKGIDWSKLPASKSRRSRSKRIDFGIGSDVGDSGSNLGDTADDDG